MLQSCVALHSVIFKGAAQSPGGENITYTKCDAVTKVTTHDVNTNKKITRFVRIFIKPT